MKGVVKHLKKVSEIESLTLLRPEEAITIAKQYHEKMNLTGVVNEDVNSLLFDDKYVFKINKIDVIVKPVWEVSVDIVISNLEPVDYILIVSDQDKEVIGMLDSYYLPMELPKERKSDFSCKFGDNDDDDDEHENGDDNDDEIDENWKGILKSFDDDE